MIKNAFISSGLILIAAIMGGLSGFYIEGASVLGDYVDYLILALVFLVFVDVQIDKIFNAIKSPKVLVIALITNFAILPFLGFGLTKVLLPNYPVVAIGVAIYFMSPCTDWFLGFTRMAKGNTGLGGVLLPVNMLIQLLLYPFFVQWFSHNTVASVSAQDITQTLFDWFLVPFLAAMVVKAITYKRLEVVANVLSEATDWVIYALVVCIFAANIEVLLNHMTVFLWVLLTVVAFFVITLVITEVISRQFDFELEDKVLYTMTTTARNAPLMLGITKAALPDQPLIYAALIIGMLIEFPYLAAQVLRFTKGKNS